MPVPSESHDPFPREISRHYEEAAHELQRLSTGLSRLEMVRTQELVKRYLPPPPAVVFDVGGGPGVYSCWLAREGYEVHLVDAVPLHVAAARKASQEQPYRPIASLAVGDARKLDRLDASVDAVLLFGPLYHLTDRSDRLMALREARRILRSEGLVLAVAICRFASAFDGLFCGFLDDPEFVKIVQRDLTDGQHQNPTNNQNYFTTSFFHRPEELKSEIEEAGLRHEATLAVDGPACRLQNFDDHWNDPGRRERLLNMVRALESEPSLLGCSAHIMAVCHV